MDDYEKFRNAEEPLLDPPSDRGHSHQCGGCGVEFPCDCNSPSDDPQDCGVCTQEEVFPAPSSVPMPAVSISEEIAQLKEEVRQLNALAEVVEEKAELMDAAHQAREALKVAMDYIGECRCDIPAAQRMNCAYCQAVLAINRIDLLSQYRG